MKDLARTRRTPSTATEQAMRHAEGSDDRRLFRLSFDRFRAVAPRLSVLSTGPLELETLGFIARLEGPVQEAALVEALASLRADGVTL